MQTTTPKNSRVLASLLRADFTTQWRNRRAVVLILLVPVIILISWRDLIDRIGGTFALSSCITIGLTAIGLMGYTNSVARDRDKGIFQRLRVAPVSSWSIMASRIIVQLFMILLVTLVVYIAGYYFAKITLKPVGYAFGFVTALVGGAVYLGLGQAIVGLIKNAETVSSTSRLVYFAFIMIGMFGDFGILGTRVAKIVKWSPYGTVKKIISVSLQPSAWNSDTSIALLVTLAYAIIFAVLGIKWFRWNSR